MQKLRIESYNLGDSDKATKMFDSPVCPKPRRVGSVVPDLLKPSKCGKHSQQSSDERIGTTNIISGKENVERDSICTGCSPSCYSGSPPSRTDNPLVHDVKFIHQMELFSPYARAKLSDKFSMASASPI